MDEETGRRVSSLVAGVLCADGEMSPDERSFLKRVLQHVGVDPDTVLMPTYGEDVAAELALLPEATRWETLDLVIQAAAIDGKIVPAERAIVDAIAQQLGVAPEDIVERFRRLLPPG
jgi:tellurite resistance protein